ncbi:hypothetical protein CcCBS67573_g07684 [Chytriomyces confervae]|uniref:SAM domain-containing protein n=1 Tax=Chytriomyces confervae TaxID=246404 RepID=A0A507EUH8_9FUNG|nr:hypothetical protein CcCBS67573_g07684 [Chytriomyces confervae]
MAANAAANATQDCAVLLKSFTSLKVPSASSCCDIAGITCTNNRIVRVELGSTNLRGTLPDFSKLTEMVRFRVESNLLYGTIPSSIGSLTKMTLIDIGLNGLTGEIPASISNMIALEELYIGYNKLVGGIPSSIASLAPSLRIINMADNTLTGPLPTEWGTLSLLTQLHLQDNQFTGTIPSQYGRLLNMFDFELSNNKLSGPIPSELLALPSDAYLILDGNQFSGSLTPEWSSRANLNVSINCFDGQTGSNRSSTCATVPPATSNPPSNTAAIGGGIGGAALFILLAIFAFRWYNKRRRNQQPIPTHQEPSNKPQPSHSPQQLSNIASDNHRHSRNTPYVESSYYGSTQPDELVYVLGSSTEKSDSPPQTTSSSSIRSASPAVFGGPKKGAQYQASSLMDAYTINTTTTTTTASTFNVDSGNVANLKRQLKISALDPDTSSWSVSDVQAWALATMPPRIGEKVAAKVVENGVTGAILFKLTNEHLRDDLGLVRLQDRIEFMDEREKLKDPEVEEAPAGPPVYTP